MAVALSILFLFSLTLTASRGGAVGLMGILVFAWLSSGRKTRNALLGVCLLVTVWLAAPQSFRARMKTLPTGAYRTDAGVQARFDAWRVATRMFLEHPLTGVGAGNFHSSRWARYRTREDPSAMTAHSIYFLLAAELGVSGIAAFLFLIAAVFLTNRRTRIRLARDRSREGVSCIRLAYALDASLIGYLVSGAFITVLTYPYPYLIAGLAVALSHMASRSQSLAGSAVLAP